MTAPCCVWIEYQHNTRLGNLLDRTLSIRPEALGQIPVTIDVTVVARSARTRTKEPQGAREVPARPAMRRGSLRLHVTMAGELIASQDADNWSRLLSRPEAIARVARRLRTWDADRAVSVAAMRVAVPLSDDLVHNKVHTFAVTTRDALKRVETLGPCIVAESGAAKTPVSAIGKLTLYR